MASFPFFYLANFAKALFKRAIPSSISCSGIIREGVKRTTLGPAIKASNHSSPAHVVMSFALPAYSAFSTQPINKP